MELTEKVSGIDSNLKLEKVKQKLELVGIICNDACIPGQYNRLFCPQVCAFCSFIVIFICFCSCFNFGLNVEWLCGFSVKEAGQWREVCLFI